MSGFKIGDRVRDVSPHAAGLGTTSGTIVGKDEGDNWVINWDATPYSRINWHDHQIKLIENPLQAEVERLRTALDTLYRHAASNPTGAKGWNAALRQAESALSGSKE